MKNLGWILAISLAASAWAQTPAAKPPAGLMAGKPVAASVKLPVPPPAASRSALPAAQQKPPARALAGRLVQRRAESSNAAATKTATTKAVVTEARRSKGQRDPFVSPIAERARTGPVCTGIGKHCLYVGDLILLGIVESDQGVIAVVASGNRTYFLREHDPLADGDVEKITRNAITMKQRSSDLLGRRVVRQVTRKLGGPAA